MILNYITIGFRAPLFKLSSARVVRHLTKESRNICSANLDNSIKPKTNKSGLLTQHRNVLNEFVPYNVPQSWIHLTEKYQRKIFGRYGSLSGLNPRICFNTKIDLNAKSDYKSASQPSFLSELIINTRKEQVERQNVMSRREEEIAKKLEKLDQWKKELNIKIAKKEADALAAKARKERLIEEVRKHFGFKVDPKEDRFKEMLEQKEREDKKKQKEEKRKAKESKIMAKLAATPTGLQ